MNVLELLGALIRFAGRAIRFVWLAIGRAVRRLARTVKHHFRSGV